jgi:hypothetical protein
MRPILLFVPALITFSVQAQHPVVQGIIDAVEIDSLMHYVEEISGEIPIDIGDGPVTIVSRHKDNPGNALAQAYFEQRFAALGYTSTIQSSSLTGRNILVTKTGAVYPDEIVILCAHYDALPGGIVAAPAADDDGSGCAAVLEAARILRDIPFEYTIVFALWDEEEQGKLGSIFYANQMAANDALIRGVVNMDAIAYDGNGDTKARVHTRSVANSQAIADTVFAVLDTYGIDLDLIRTDPGATYSDHASFWSAGYGAVLMIEEFGADGNPGYHTPNDRVNLFDVPYYEKLAKLSIGSLAAYAVPFDPAAAVDDRNDATPTRIYAYPNPSSTETTIWIDLPATRPTYISLVNTMGQVVQVLHDGVLQQGKRALRVPLERLAPGTYSVVVRAEGTHVYSTSLVRTP